MRKWFPEHSDWWEEERIAHEHAHLKMLWEKARPLDKQSEDILRATLALEICNWNLEESILALCRAIGKKKAPPSGSGTHLPSPMNAGGGFGPII